MLPYRAVRNQDYSVRVVVGGAHLAEIPNKPENESVGPPPSAVIDESVGRVHPGIPLYAVFHKRPFQLKRVLWSAAACPRFI